MNENEREDGIRRKKRKQLIKKKRKNRILLAVTGTALVFCVLYILDLKLQLKEMRASLGEAESVRQEAMGTGEEHTAAAEADSLTAGTDSLAPGKQSDYRRKSYAEGLSVVEVEKPREYTREEAVQKLKELGRDDPVLENICKNSDSYPDKLLTALANNPEMKDFAAGYLTAHREAGGGLTESEKEQDFPLFLQWDPRWGYCSYGSSIVGLTGCGPACISMILYYLLHDEALTPDYIAAYAMENGYWVEGSGTAWQLMDDVPALYGLTVKNIHKTEETMLTALERGGVMIASVGRGDFTVYGHFIVIYGCEEDGFLVNDPNCAERSRRHWTFEQIGEQIKNIWVYEKP